MVAPDFGRLAGLASPRRNLDLAQRSAKLNGFELEVEERSLGAGTRMEDGWMDDGWGSPGG